MGKQIAILTGCGAACCSLFPGNYTTYGQTYVLQDWPQSVPKLAISGGTVELLLSGPGWSDLLVDRHVALRDVGSERIVLMRATRCTPLQPSDTTFGCSTSHFFDKNPIEDLDVRMKYHTGRNKR